MVLHGFHSGLPEDFLYCWQAIATEAGHSGRTPETLGYSPTTIERHAIDSASAYAHYIAAEKIPDKVFRILTLGGRLTYAALTSASSPFRRRPYLLWWTTQLLNPKHRWRRRPQWPAVPGASYFSSRRARPRDRRRFEGLRPASPRRFESQWQLPLPRCIELARPTLGGPDAGASAPRQ